MTTHEKSGAGGSRRVLVRFDAVAMRFGPVTAIDGLSLDIYDAEFLALLGPSGCGKTTLLRMLAGFETPQEGRIVLAGEDITSAPPHRRPVNMMFQSYALFPHLSVEGNIAFGLKQEKLPKAEIAARVADALALVRLEGLGHRRPDTLSGGQRQRVALARSLVKRPRVLLLDEPLAALDKKLREETQFELMALQRKLGTTFVIVTHDQDEAMIVADRIAVMNRGRLAQVGAPAEIYERPQSRWIAEFVGDVGLLEGNVRASTIETAHGTFALGGAVANDGKAWLALRPEKIALAREKPAAGNAVAAIVAEVGYRGDITLYQARLADGTNMKVSAPNSGHAARGVFSIGDAVWLSWSAEAAVLLRQ